MTTTCRRCGAELGYFENEASEERLPFPAGVTRITCTESYNEITNRTLAEQIRSECFARMIDRDVEELLRMRVSP